MGSDRRSTRLDDDLSFLLARANALAMSRGNAVLAPFGLKVRSYSLLALASAEPGPSQREIAEHLRLDPSQVVALVDELQRKGLVERVPDRADRRANLVTVTRAGRELGDRASAELRRAQERSHADLPAEDRARLADLLHRLAFPPDFPE